MGFQQGLSGLNSSSRNLDVIGHNIANANTVGMKASRVEFAEVYASSINASGGTNAGIGVTVAATTQMFTQGNITVTGNDLDVAINGNGFYELTMPTGGMAYSRSGLFKLNNEGQVVTNLGGQLMGYPTDSEGTRLSFTTQPLSLPTGGPIPARATSNVAAEFNLDARAPVAATAVPPTPLSKYGTSVIAYDPQGLEIPVGFAFEKTAVNQWNVYTSVNGSDPAASTPFMLQFNTDGSLDPATPDPAADRGISQQPGRVLPAHAGLRRRDAIRHRFRGQQPAAGRLPARRTHQSQDRRDRRHHRQLLQRPDPRGWSDRPRELPQRARPAAHAATATGKPTSPPASRCAARRARANSAPCVPERWKTRTSTSPVSW